MSDWITLEEARDLARCRGATDGNLGEILGDNFRRLQIGITGLLEDAPIERVRTHWPGLAAELDVMRSRRTPHHIEEFLTRTIGPVRVEPWNRFRVMILWGGGAPPLQADTCVFRAVHLYRRHLVFELEAAGFPAVNGEGEAAASNVEPAAGAVASNSQADGSGALPKGMTDEQKAAEEEKKKRQFLKWGGGEKEKHGSYPPMQPLPRNARLSVRGWAAQNNVKREIA